MVDVVVRHLGVARCHRLRRFLCGIWRRERLGWRVGDMRDDPSVAEVADSRPQQLVVIACLSINQKWTI